MEGQGDGDPRSQIDLYIERNLRDASSQADYRERRALLVDDEESSAWYQRAKQNASSTELEAAKIVWKIREDERGSLYGDKASEAVPGPHTRDMGGQFLTNIKRIERSKIFYIAKNMPKGAHLHLHFNAELHPKRSVERAREQETMFVRSTRPLLKHLDFQTAEMVFDVLPADTDTADIFSENYNPEFKAPGCRPWMRWKDFCENFAHVYDGDPETWIAGKMVLSEHEAYGTNQTLNG
jgi:adenosine deaminase CECR1